jgi:biotin carboxyl carrier protein
VEAVKISAKAGQQPVELTIERRDGNYLIKVGGEPHHVDVHKLEGDFYSFLMEGRSYEVSVEPRGDTYYVRHGATELLVTMSDPSRQAREAKGADGVQEVATMMPGRVVRTLVQEGDEVEAGQGLVVVEAMKMENEIAATRPGRVTSLKVQPGQTVEGGAVLVVVE